MISEPTFPLHESETVELKKSLAELKQGLISLAAIINAFCHRDWRDPDYVQIALYKDRVEIRNPGLLDGLTLADLRRGHISRCRNPLIADLLRRIEMVEGWGHGMPLILKNAPNVEFREIAHLFIARFARPSFVAGETAERPETAQETTGSVGAQRIIELLKTNPNATRQQLAAQTGLSADGVKYHLNKLKTAGRIRHVGSTKNGYWEILDGVKEEGEGL